MRSPPATRSLRAGARDTSGRERRGAARRCGPTGNASANDHMIIRAKELAPPILRSDTTPFLPACRGCARKEGPLPRLSTSTISAAARMPQCAREAAWHLRRTPSILRDVLAREDEAASGVLDGLCRRLCAGHRWITRCAHNAGLRTWMPTLRKRGRAASAVRADIAVDPQQDRRVERRLSISARAGREDLLRSRMPSNARRL